jgi:hypothetical protein
MKKKILIVLLISLLVLAVPAVAKEKEPIGERINIIDEDPEVFPAGEPFHISHGVLQWPPYDTPVGIMDFDLDVDGEFREEDYIDRFAVSYHGDSPDVVWLWYHNFPEGLPAGEHTFVGHWFVSCLTMDGPPCSNPNELVEFFAWEHTVIFE